MAVLGQEGAVLVEEEVVVVEEGARGRSYQGNYLGQDRRGRVVWVWVEWRSEGEGHGWKCGGEKVEAVGLAEGRSLTGMTLRTKSLTGMSSMNKGDDEYSFFTRLAAERS